MDGLYDVDLPRTCSGRIMAFLASELVPIYDGNEKVSWSSVIWKPQGMKAHG